MKCTMLMTTKLNLNFSTMLMSTFKKKLAAMAIMWANILQNYKLFLLKLSFCWLFVALINSLFIDHNFLFLVLHFSPRNEKLKKNENKKFSFSLQPILMTSHYSQFMYKANQKISDQAKEKKGRVIKINHFISPILMKLGHLMLF